MELQKNITPPIFVLFQIDAIQMFLLRIEIFCAEINLTEFFGS